MLLTLSSSLLSTTEILSSSSPLVLTLDDLLRPTPCLLVERREPSLRLLFWWTASRTRSMSVLRSDSCKHGESDLAERVHFIYTNWLWQQQIPSLQSLRESSSPEGSPAQGSNPISKKSFNFNSGSNLLHFLVAPTDMYVKKIINSLNLLSPKINVCESQENPSPVWVCSEL